MRIWPLGLAPASLIKMTPLKIAGRQENVFLEDAYIVKKHIVARLTGITDRDAAKQLTGALIEAGHAADDALSLRDAEEYYHSQLLGLAVFDQAGRHRGAVMGISDFGAGALLEVGRQEHESFFVPFSKIHTPTIDLAGKQIIINWQEDI